MLSILKWDYAWKENRFCYLNFQLILLWDFHCFLHMDAEGADIWRFFFPVFLVCFADLNNSAGMLDLGCYLRWQQILGWLEEALITCFILQNGCQLDCAEGVYLDVFFPRGRLQIVTEVASYIKVCIIVLYTIYNSTNGKRWHEKHLTWK